MTISPFPLEQEQELWLCITKHVNTHWTCSPAVPATISVPGFPQLLPEMPVWYPINSSVTAPRALLGADSQRHK